MISSQLMLYYKDGGGVFNTVAMDKRYVNDKVFTVVLGWNVEKKEWVWENIERFSLFNPSSSRTASPEP